MASDKLKEYLLEDPSLFNQIKTNKRASLPSSFFQSPETTEGEHRRMTHRPKQSYIRGLLRSVSAN